MDRLLRKFGQKYKRAREAVDKWDSLQAHLLNLFSNAVGILERLPVIVDGENYGVLKNVDGMINHLPAKQVQSMECIFAALQRTLDDLARVKDALEKAWSESCQLLKAEKLQPTSMQAQQRFSLGPSLNECVKGLEELFVMHRDEFYLKVSIVSALSYNSRLADAVAMQTVLAEQPNIPLDEVRFIFDFFYAGYST